MEQALTFSRGLGSVVPTAVVHLGAVIGLHVYPAVGADGSRSRFVPS